MHTYTPEQTEDFKARTLAANNEIAAVLEKYEVSMSALPVFEEVTSGQCIAVAKVRLNDLKYAKTPVIETEESAAVTDDLVGKDA